MSTAENKANIQANRRKIFELENDVQRNRALAYGTRALIQENGALIKKNYEAAFMGNRQLINFNTDAIFRNRTAAVRNVKADNDVQTNFREALTNRTKLEFLAHRARLNERVIKVSQRFTEINRSLLELNKDILETNEELVRYNRDAIAHNTELLTRGADSGKATPESNAELIKANSKLIAEVRAKVDANRKRTEEVRAAEQKNRELILKNSETINGRRREIEANTEKIAENQGRVASFISNL